MGDGGVNKAQEKALRKLAEGPRRCGDLHPVPVRACVKRGWAVYGMGLEYYFEHNFVAITDQGRLVLGIPKGSG